jgi:hypothetical protein
MEFIVKESFDLEGFILECRNAGVKLVKSAPEEIVDGYFEMSSDHLKIILSEVTPEKTLIVANAIAKFNI